MKRIKKEVFQSDVSRVLLITGCTSSTVLYDTQPQVLDTIIIVMDSYHSLQGPAASEVQVFSTSTARYRVYC